VLCAALAHGDDTEALILHRGEHGFIILNLYPYNSGHAMVVPYAHAATLEDLSPADRAELFELAELFTRVATSVLRCSGFNLGMNQGELAGAGVADHLHLHVVPRWLGDANFMPLLADTMVMPELLPVTYARLRAELERTRWLGKPDSIVQAGAVVVVPARQAVALRKARNGDIVLPKGHIDPGETPAETAVREAREETGLDAEIVGWAGVDDFTGADRGQPGIDHHVVFLLTRATVTPELDAHLGVDTVLVSPDQVLATLTHQSQRDVVANVLDDVFRLAEVER